MSAKCQPHVRELPSSPNDRQLGAQVQEIVSHSTTSPDALGSAFFQGGILWKRCGGCQSLAGNLLKNDLNLILILSTLLSPQIILQCKRFPAAFGESPRSVPQQRQLFVGYWSLLIGLGFHYCGNVTEPPSAPICKFSSFEVR